jgi:hypothetical protein
MYFFLKWQRMQELGSIRAEGNGLASTRHCEESGENETFLRNSIECINEF